MKKLLIVFMLVAACGSDGSGGDGGNPGDPDGGGNPPGPDASNPVGDKITLGIEPFDVQPGTERQVCKIVNLPEGQDYDIVRMHSLMQGTSHHMNVYKFIDGSATTPATPEEGMVDDCTPAQEQFFGQAAYIFGAATPERTLDTPEGVAFHLLGGQRIILEQHVINATDEVAQGSVSFDLYPAAPGSTIEHHADIAWFAAWDIELPAGETTEVTEYCTFDYDVEVFGLMSHTHRLGTHFTIREWSGGAGAQIYESTDWEHPIYQEYSPRLSLDGGEGLEWTCEYMNTTGSDVSAGQNSTDEMCMTFAVYYPRDTLSGATMQCNKPFQP